MKETINTQQFVDNLKAKIEDFNQQKQHYINNLNLISGYLNAYEQLVTELTAPEKVVVVPPVDVVPEV